MGARRHLPDIMGEALGRLGIPPAPSPPPARLALAPLSAAEAKPGANLADRLGSLGLKGMAQALREETQGETDVQPQALGVLEQMLAREEELRHQRGLQSRLRRARLAQQGSLDDLDQPAQRGLDPDFLAQLGECAWVAQGRNLLLMGQVGAGKTYLACALARRACQAGHTALYARVPEVLEALAVARRQGRWATTLAALSRPQLLVLDDWGLMPLEAGQAADLLELAEARHGRRSTLIASARSEEDWPGLLPAGLAAQALLDRWTPGSLRVALRGASRRG